MSYVVNIDISKLKPHPVNEEIYSYKESEHEELKKSVELNGLIEPIVVQKDNTILSGHRRYKVVKELGFESVECRLVHPTSDKLFLVESNRTRTKTTEELLKEADILREEYSRMSKMGRPLNGEIRNGKNWTILQVSDQLNTSTTKLKKLYSIRKHREDLLKDIDLGLISVHQAYEVVRKTCILEGNGGRPKTKSFDSELQDLMDKYGYDQTQLWTNISLRRMNGIEMEAGQRDINDFYPTHPIITQALLDRETLTGSTWEPACGEGDMSKVLIENGYDVLSTDLIDRGYGQGGVDFLDDNQIKKYGKVDNIITNPPFSLGNEFVLQAKKYARKKVFILNKTLFLDSVGRYEKVWNDKEFPLKTMYQLVGRVPFRKNNTSEELKGGLLSFAWYMFEKGYTGRPEIKWIPPVSRLK